MGNGLTKVEQGLEVPGDEPILPRRGSTWRIPWSFDKESHMCNGRSQSYGIQAILRVVGRKEFNQLKTILSKFIVDFINTRLI